jgi:hypothetical protein
MNVIFLKQFGRREFNKMDCTNCIYNNDESRSCDENSCSRAHHYFYSHPAEFAEKYLGIRLYPWQKTLLEGVENLDARTTSRYIPRR